MSLTHATPLAHHPSMDTSGLDLKDFARQAAQTLAGAVGDVEIVDGIDLDDHPAHKFSLNIDPAH